MEKYLKYKQRYVNAILRGGSDGATNEPPKTIEQIQQETAAKVEQIKNEANNQIELIQNKAKEQIDQIEQIEKEKIRYHQSDFNYKR